MPLDFPCRDETSRGFTELDAPPVVVGEHLVAVGHCSDGERFPGVLARSDDSGATWVLERPPELRPASPTGAFLVQTSLAVDDRLVALTEEVDKSVLAGGSPSGPPEVRVVIVSER